MGGLRHREPDGERGPGAAPVTDRPPDDGARVVIPLREREKRAVTVARTILGSIRHDHLQPGDRLPSEATMLDRYQVGRSTLREALRILEVQGLIRIRYGPGGGPEVRAPTPRDFSRMLTLSLQGIDVTVEHLLDARCLTEPLMAMLAAGCDDRDQRDDLRAILERTTSAVEWDDFTEAMSAFHTRVLSMSGNPVLELWSLALQHAANDAGPIPLPDEARESIRREHLAIGEAILSGDADQAWSLMADHMDKYEQHSGHDAGYHAQLVEWQ